MVVNAKPVDKLTMTAEATKAKQITVTFNKAVDIATTKITVKKGSATPTTTVSFEADGKSTTIAMGTKLTEGTYTVEATVGTETLKQDITVQDEKLTKFELVAPYLVASAKASDETEAEAKTKGSISYKALNQYGEMMPVDTISASCTLGTLDDNKTPTADRAGKLSIKDIPDILTVPGTQGTVTIVDTSSGIQLNETITYQTKAVAAKATVYGIYDDKKEKLLDRNLRTNEKVTDYWMLFNIQSQYDADMTLDDVIKSGCSVDYNVASVLTDVSLAEKKVVSSNHREIQYDGKSCILVKIHANGNENGKIYDAGTMGLTIVSAERGVIASPSFTIDEEVIIKSLNVYPKGSIYAGVDNELVVEAIDENGNAVTNYDVLKASVSGTTLKKNADGTGTFYVKPGVSYDRDGEEVIYSGSKDKKYKDNEPITLIFTANDPTSGHYMVKSFNFKMYAKQEGWKVAGITDKTVTAAASGSALKLELKSLKYEDQYSNELDYKAGQVDMDNVSAYLVDKDGVFGAATEGRLLTVADQGASSTKQSISLTAQKKGTATLYLRYINRGITELGDKDKGNQKASDDYYDIKVTLAGVDSKSISKDDITVKINNGNAIYGVKKATLNKNISNSTVSEDDAKSDFNVDVVVSAKIGGKTIVLPIDQWEIVDGKELGNYKAPSDNTNLVKTEEKTVSIVVQTDDGPVTVSQKVTVSNAWRYAASISAVDGKNKNTVKGVSGSAIDYSAFVTATGGDDSDPGVVEIKDQYGNHIDKAADVQYTVTFTGAGATDLQENCVSKNGTPAMTLNLKGGKYTATVTYKLGTIEYTQDVNIQVSDS